MKYIRVDGPIDAKLVEYIIRIFDELKNGLDMDVTVLFNSTGGDTAFGREIMVVFEDMINLGYRLHFKATGEVRSAAFVIFFMSKATSRTVYPDSVGMMHNVSIDIKEEYRPGEKQSGYTTAQKGYVNLLNEFYFEKLTQLIPNNWKQLKVIKSAKDAFFYYPELSQLSRIADERDRLSDGVED